MNDWKLLAKRLAGLAPAIGTALGGPTGALVGAVLADRLGVPATPGAIATALEADPDALARVAEVEAEVAIAAMQDQQNAREVYKGHWLPPVLTMTLVGMVAALTGALFFLEIPEANRDMVNFVLGNLFGWAGAAITFWIGSSRGSAEKQAEISRAK